jgi:hypothetical protein
MKQIEKFLMLILILTIISTSGTYLSNILLVKLYGAAQYSQMAFFDKVVASIFSVFRMLVNICVAIWLFVAAREHKAQAWAWCVFGVFFGLAAAIFFYLVCIYETLRARSEVGPDATN